MIQENKFLKHFKHIPIGATGLAVGVGGIGNLYTSILMDNGVENIVCASIIQIICTSISITLLLLVLLRNVVHKNTFSNELSHPLLSSFLPTIFMTLMIIGGFFGWIGKMIDANEASKLCQAFKGIGAIIWYGAIAGHLIFLTLFIIKIVTKHNIKKDALYASWFVPPIGIIVACTVYRSFSGSIEWIPNIFAQIIWYFGFLIYLIVLPIVSYKLIFHRNEDKNTLPSIAIFGAPANLSLTGFIAVFDAKNIHYYNETFKNIIILSLVCLGICTTLLVYLLLARIFKIKFNPTYASLTFPLAIGSTAIYKSSMYLHNLSEQTNLIDNLYWTLKIVSFIELAIASTIIAYVLIRYVLLIIEKIKNTNLSTR